MIISLSVRGSVSGIFLYSKYLAFIDANSNVIS